MRTLLTLSILMISSACFAGENFTITPGESRALSSRPEDVVISPTPTVNIDDEGLYPSNDPQLLVAPMIDDVEDRARVNIPSVHVR